MPAGAGGGATAASRRVDLRRVGDYASPHDRGGGGGPAGQGTAASPRGGTRGPDKGHGRASEEGT